MGITLGDAILYLRGDQTQLDKDLQSAETKTKGLFGGLAGSANALIGGAIVGAAATATATVVGIGAAAFDVSSDMRDATNEIKAQLGATEEDAKRLGEVAKTVWKDNFGGSIEEATQAVITARQQLGDLTDQELQDATENAFRLSDAYGVDVVDSLSAVRTLMKEYELSQQEAFDFLAAGFQRGLNSSGDFLDSVGEYSNLFAENRLSADQFFSALETGLAGGVLGTDKIGDAFKEAGIRLLEGGDDVSAAFDQMGMDFERISGFIASGDEAWGDYYSNILDGLRSIEDPIERNKAGVAIFGTQWEDLGASAVLAVDLTNTKLDELAGATDKIDALYDNWPSMWEGIKRNALAALTPLGDKLLALANDLMPQVQAAFDWLSVALPPAVDWVVQKFGEFYAYIQANVLPILQQMGDWLINEGIPAYIEFITPIIQQVVPGLQLLVQIGMNLASVVWPMLVQATQFVIDNWNILEPIVIAIGVAILALTSPVTLVAGLIVTLATAWANNWGGIQDKTQAVFDFIVPLIDGAMKGIQTIVEPILEYLSQWWEAHGDNVILIITTVFDFVVSRIQDRINQAKAIIQVVGEAIRIFWDAWGSTLMEIARLAWDTITTLVKAGMDIIGYTIDAIAAVIRGDWEAFGDALTGIWETVWNTIETIVTNQIDAVIAVIENLIEQVETLWQDFVNWMVEVWESTWDSIVDYVEGVVDAIIEPINDMIEAIEDLFNLNLPTIPGFGGKSAPPPTTSNKSYNLTVNTTQSSSSVVGEYQAMEAMLGT